MFKDFERFRNMLERESVVEISGIRVHPILIKIKTTGIDFHGIIYPNSQIFIPINSKSDMPLLESMKSQNKKNFVNAPKAIIHPAMALLGLHTGGYKRMGPELSSWTALADRHGSTGIEFLLNVGEGLKTKHALDIYSMLYPNLLFKEEKLRKGSN